MMSSSKNQEDMVTLTRYLKAFHVSMAKLKKIFCQVNSSPRNMRDAKAIGESRRSRAIERLGEVLRMLRVILEEFPAIRSTDLLMAAGNMIQRIKGHKYEAESALYLSCQKTGTSHAKSHSSAIVTLDIGQSMAGTSDESSCLESIMNKKKKDEQSENRAMEGNEVLRYKVDSSSTSSSSFARVQTSETTNENSHTEWEHLVEQVKKELLVQIREMIHLCDQSMKAVTFYNYQLQHSATSPGGHFQEFVSRRHHPTSPSASPNSSPSSSTSSTCDNKSPPQPQSHIYKSYSTADATRNHRLKSLSDSESIESGEESVIRVLVKDAVTASSGEDIENHESEARKVSSKSSSSSAPRAFTPGLSKSATMTGVSKLSKAAQSHAFKKLKTPSRCRECDSYLYFQGLECAECGIASHKKCLASLKIVCGHKKLSRKTSTFGSFLSSQAGRDTIPAIVAKCILEIDARGVQIKGLYRVSGVKSKVEKLCQAFENGVDLVDLSDVHPNVIANVLKLYFRQLPEPLLTFRLYQEFIKVAKDFPGTSRTHGSLGSLYSTVQTTYNKNELQEIHRLVQVVSKLPATHFLTLAYLIHHLKRVSNNSSENNMPSSNLGIVFGPTLLRTTDGGNSLTSLVDTVHQTRVIDLLITYCYQVFGSPIKVNSQGHILGFMDEEETCLQEMEVISSQERKISLQPHSSHPGLMTTSSPPGIVVTTGQQVVSRGETSRTSPSASLTQRQVNILNNNVNNEHNNKVSNVQFLDTKSHLGHYSSTAVITLGGHQVIAGGFAPQKSVSSSAIVPASRNALPASHGQVVTSTTISHPPVIDVQADSLRRKSDLQQLRRQFFTSPIEGSDRKDSNEGESTTDEDTQWQADTMTASGNQAKLKRTGSRAEQAAYQQLLLQQQITDHHPQYAMTSQASHRSTSANPRLRFMETEILSRSASATTPFSPWPEDMSNAPTSRRPKFV